MINGGNLEFQDFVAAAEARTLDGKRHGGDPLPIHETIHPHEALLEDLDWEMNSEFMAAIHGAREIFNPAWILEPPHELHEHEAERLSQLRHAFGSGKSKQFRRLGSYTSAEREINLYRCPQGHREIVRVHERMHAMQHLLPDDRGQPWERFHEAHRIYKELLAQLFTYKYFEYKGGQKVCEDMDDMALSQGFVYNTYRLFSHWDPRDCVTLYCHIRQHNGLPGIFDNAMAKPLKKKSPELASRALRNISTGPTTDPLHVLIKRSGPQSTKRVCQVRDDDTILMPDTPAAHNIKPMMIGIVVDDEGRVESRFEFRSPSVPDHQLPKHRIAMITRPQSWVHRARLQSISFEDRAPSRRVGANVLSHSALSAIVAAADLHEKWMGSVKEKVVDKF